MAGENHSGQGLDLMKLFALREEFGASANKGDVVFAPGQPADKFFVLMRGSVQVEHPGSDPEVVAPGDLFGEVEVFTDQPRASKATAVDDSSMLAFSRETAIKLAEATPSFALVVIRKSAERVARLETLLASAPKPAVAPASAPAAAQEPAAAPEEAAPAPVGDGSTVGPVFSVDYADVLWKKDIKCPNCRTTFHAWNVRSQGINVTDRDSDFMNHYAGVDPNWYAVWVCPNCNLSAYGDDFASMQSVQLARAKPQLEEAVKADSKKYDYSYYRDGALALRSYQLAVAFYEGMKGGNEKCAGLYHRMAWVERGRADEEAEKAYLVKAREYYEKAFATSDAAKQGVLWAYLIAEIAYRTGQYLDAVKWFGTAAQQPDFKAQPLLEKMVRDRWSDAGDMARTQAPDQPAAAKS